MVTVARSAYIAAAPEAIVRVMLDVGEHPTWQREIERIDVLETDEQGRPLRTRVRAGAMGASATSVVRYEYTSPTSFEYHMSEPGDVMTRNDFTFRADASGDGSQVHLTQEIATRLPLPSFVVERLARKGIDALLANLARLVEPA